MTKIQSFCLFTPLKVLAISIQLSILLIWPVSWMEYRFPVWLKPDMGSWTLWVILLVNIFVSVFSSTVALNIYKAIRNNAFLSFLTFFLPVILFYISILLNIQKPGSGYTLFILLAFLIPQVFYFIRFRKRIKAGDFD